MSEASENPPIPQRVYEKMFVAGLLDRVMHFFNDFDHDDLPKTVGLATGALLDIQIRLRGHLEWLEEDAE